MQVFDAFQRLIERVFVDDGFATPMRGKSLTCRKRLLSIAVAMTAVFSISTFKALIPPLRKPNRVGDPENSRGRFPASHRLAAHRRGRAMAQTARFDNT